MLCLQLVALSGSVQKAVNAGLNMKIIVFVMKSSTQKSKTQLYNVFCDSGGAVGKSDKILMSSN